MTLNKLLWVAVFLLTIIILPQGYVSAYLDPGTGSLIVQFVVAGVLGLVVAIKLFWGKIIGIFQRGKSSSDGDNQD